MKKEEILKLTPDYDKIPVGCLVWQKKPKRKVSHSAIISRFHNTSHYPLDNTYKPISKTIDFNER